MLRQYEAYLFWREAFYSHMPVDISDGEERVSSNITFLWLMEEGGKRASDLRDERMTRNPRPRCAYFAVRTLNH